MQNDGSQRNDPADVEKKVLCLLGDLFYKARSLHADRIIISPLYLYGKDNVVFVIPETDRHYRTATTTETWWQAVVERIKVDAGLDCNICNTSQDGEVIYYVNGWDDSRVFVSMRTKWCDGHESARLLIA